MFNKIYEEVKSFIKENYKFLIFIIIFAIVINIRVPYYVYSGGGIQDLSKRFELSETQKVTGSYNLSYVTELEGTVLTYGLSYIMPNWERVKVSSYQYNETESVEELSKRNKLDLNYANQTAVSLAYAKAGKTFNIKNSNYYVYYKLETSENEFQVGDKLLEIDGQKITDIDIFSNIINAKKENDKVIVKVLRDKKEKEVEATIQKEEDRNILGISILTLYDYETDPSISLKFKENESGSSAGLMLTLAIYDSLTKEDLSAGRKIAGTGTIASDGTVGPIGGVKYKLIGAVHDKADVFLVPLGENYEECMKLKKEKNYKIKIIGVSSLDDAIEALQTEKV